MPCLCSIARLIQTHYSIDLRYRPFSGSVLPPIWLNFVFYFWWFWRFAENSEGVVQKLTVRPLHHWKNLAQATPLLLKSFKKLGWRSSHEGGRPMTAYASGALGFSFACGQRPRAKLSPWTERSSRSVLVRLKHDFPNYVFACGYSGSEKNCLGALLE